MNKKPRKIDVLLFDNVNTLDVAGPAQAFDAAFHEGEHLYQHRFVTLDGGTVRSDCGLQLTADGKLSDPTEADDLLIPGGPGANAMCDNPEVLNALRAHLAKPGNGRLISICSGALVLAAAGVLDGLTATTHWSSEARARTYEQVNWDLDRISVSHDRIFTSAGVTTGIDLALAIIRADHGRQIALEVARELVVQLRRTGGQSQYAIHIAGQPSSDDSLSKLIEAVVARPDQDWTLEALAAEAGLNPRTLSRHFQRDIGLSPAQFVERTRVDHARGLLSETLPLKSVAARSGFGDLQRMRRAFQRRFGVSIADYKRLFGAEGRL